MSTVEGFTYLIKIKSMDFKIPVSQSIDLKVYIFQFSTDFLENTINQAGEIWNNVVDFFT